MVTSRQRQRQLARTRWERQQTRRTAAAARTRRTGIVVGVIVALVAAAALVWLIRHIVNAEETRNQQQIPAIVPTGLTAPATSPPGTPQPSAPATTSGTVSVPPTSHSSGGPATSQVTS